jgi:hypothetical protein
VSRNENENKSHALLIISADFLQGKSAFCPFVFLCFWASEGRTESRIKSCPRWQTARAARDENTLKLVATEKLSSFFLLSVREVLAVDKK